MQDKPTHTAPYASANAADAFWLKEALLTRIIAHLPIPVFAKDAQNGYRFSLWNKAAEDLFGIPADKMLGFTDYDLFPKPQADHFRVTDEKVFAGHKVVDIAEEPISTPNGEMIAHTVKVPIYDSDGKPAILLGIVENITERKASLELMAAKVRAENATQAKTEFLAHMSHELRTPLNSILGMTKLLQRTKLDEKQASMLTLLDQASELLLKTVNDVLDFSKSEAGQIELEHIPFDATEIFQQTVALLRGNAQHLVLTLVTPETPMPRIMGDPTRLASVLNNLVGNALKYTQQGSVTVHMDWRESDDGNIELAAAIEDTGIGIPAEKHDAIFQEFSQADSSFNRRYGGTGLGLAITKQLIDLMQGEIGLESEPNKGSIFWFRIPFDRAATVATTETVSPPSPSMGLRMPGDARLLMAEDNSMNQMFLRQLLEANGFTHYDIAADGVEAMELFRTHRYDFILMDCQMPRMSGYEAARAIREHEAANGGHVPIIALTAHVLPGEREKCLAAGMDDYLSKPIDLQQFRSLLGQWYALPSVENTIAASTRPDDDPIDLNTLRVFARGNRDEERTIANLFARQSDDMLKKLRMHCVDGPSRDWTEAAHFLKGSAGNLGAQKLCDLCDEAQAQHDTKASTRRAILLKMESEITRIKDFFDQEGLLAA